MKKFYYLVAGVLSMGMLASCSNEDEIAAGNGNDQQANAYLSLTLVGADNGASRTQPGEDETLSGDENDSSISDALVLLCNEQGVVQAVKTIGAPTSKQINGQNVLQTERIPVDPGTYYVYVIANPDDGLDEKIEINKTDVNDFAIDGITAQTISDNYAKDKNFIMFNECNGNGDTEENNDIKGTKVIVGVENTYDHPATPESTIKLDRLVAKITYKEKEGGVDISAAKTDLSALTAVEFNGFTLINGIKTTYLQQRWSKVAPIASLFAKENTLLTPTVTNDSETSFYNLWKNFSTIVNEGTDENPNYTTVIDLSKDDTFTDETGALYCMENNSGSTADDCFANGADLQGNTTGVLFKATATLSECDNFNGTKCFYGYNGEYFATLEALNTKYGNAFDKATQGSYNSKWEAAKAELETALAADDDDVLLSAFRTKYMIRVYEGCVMYYTHYIEDQNYEAVDKELEAPDNKTLYHAVMRNTIYGLTLSKVLGIGDDVPGGWNPDVDPEDPIDEPVYLQVLCTVNPWVLSNYDVTLQ